MKLANLNPISSADFLILVEGLGETYWTSFTGVSLDIQRPKYSDGLSNRRRTASTGTEEYGDVTISKPYDPDRDTPVIEYFEGKRNGEPFNVSVQAVRRGKNLERRSNKTIRISGCKLSNLSYPGDVNTADGGSNVAMITVTFSVEDVAYSGIENQVTPEADV